MTSQQVDNAIGGYEEDGMQDAFERVCEALEWYKNNYPSEYESYDTEGRLLMKITGLDGGSIAKQALSLAAPFRKKGA